MRYTVTRLCYLSLTLFRSLFMYYMGNLSARIKKTHDIDSLYRDLSVMLFFRSHTNQMVLNLYGDIIVYICLVLNRPT